MSDYREVYALRVALHEAGRFVCRRCFRAGELGKDAGFVLDSYPPGVYCKPCWAVLQGVP